MNKLELEGKQQIVQALQKVRIDAGFLVPNKCSECEFRTVMTKTVKCSTGNFTVTDYGCELDGKVCNAYGCDRDLLGQHGEPIIKFNDEFDERFDNFLKKYRQKYNDKTIR